MVAFLLVTLVLGGMCSEYAEIKKHAVLAHIRFNSSCFPLLLRTASPQASRNQARSAPKFDRRVETSIVVTPSSDCATPMFDPNPNHMCNSGESRSILLSWFSSFLAILLRSSALFLVSLRAAVVKDTG